MIKTIINADIEKQTVNRNIYGHFIEHIGRCVYGGIWVGRDSDIPNIDGIRSDVVVALDRLNVPVLRWPGGCFADDYHWMDGVGKVWERPLTVNLNWGNAPETNAFGTHEFLRLCELIHTQPYICGNLGSGTVREMREWVEYITSPHDSTITRLRRSNGRKEPWSLKYFGIGNENWGCGGNMRPEYYADEYRRYQTFIRSYGGDNIFKIACGATDADYNWTDVLMRVAGDYMDGYALHHYNFPGHGVSRSAVDFDTKDWYAVIGKAFEMDELITRHSVVMDKYDPDKRVALVIDEWGNWFDSTPVDASYMLYQQNTLRDAITAAINLNIFNNHAERVRMTNVAQMVNVLQSIILTDKERMLLTPTYHVYSMYRPHMGATALDIHPPEDECEYQHVSMPLMSVTATLNLDGVIHISAVNTSHEKDVEVMFDIRGYHDVDTLSASIIRGGKLNAHNTFEAPDNVRVENYGGCRALSEGVVLELPAASIVTLVIK